MNKKTLLFSLFIICLALFGCSKTGDEYLNEAKQNYNAKEYENVQQELQRKEAKIKEKSLANLKHILQTSK